jgi:hypothetical protein
MKTIITSIIIMLLLALQSTPVLAWSGERPVTPYGDFCKSCGQYGTCKNMMNPDEARKAMADYYHRKGFDVEIMKIEGRFIKAKVKNRKGVVDVIIFDRKTGRIRSIY